MYSGALIPPTHILIDAQLKKQFVEQDFGTDAGVFGGPLALRLCSTSPMSLLLQVPATDVHTVLPGSARTVHILDVKSVFVERFAAHIQVTFSFFSFGV